MMTRKWWLHLLQPEENKERDGGESPLLPLIQRHFAVADHDHGDGDDDKCDKDVGDGDGDHGIWLILRCWGKSSMVCQQKSDAL